MSWKDIIKAPYDFPKRSQARTDKYRAKERLMEAEEELRNTKPKEDVSTDVSRFASESLDAQFDRFYRAFVNRLVNQYPEETEETDEWKTFTGLMRKYGKDGLEEELGKLYNTEAFITHRPHKQKHFEDYVIDLETNKEQERLQ